MVQLDLKSVSNRFLTPSQLYKSCDDEEDWRFVECSRYPWGKPCLWPTLAHSLCQEINKSTCARTHTHRCIQPHTHASHTHTDTCAQPHTCAHTHTHTHTSSTHTYTNIHMHNHIHAHTHTHTYTPIHTDTHAHHTHTHTHTHPERERIGRHYNHWFENRRASSHLLKTEADSILPTPWCTAAKCPHHNKELYAAHREGSSMHEAASSLLRVVWSQLPPLTLLKWSPMCCQMRDHCKRMRPML